MKQLENIFSQMLESQVIQDAWACDYVAYENDNPAISISMEIKELLGELESKPELLSFMGKLIDIERVAIGAFKDGEGVDITNLREELDSIAIYLNELSKNISLPDKDGLPENYQRILDLIERKTGQVPFSPINSLWVTIKNMSEHIREDALVNPKSFSALLALSLGSLGFMNMRMGDSSTIYVDQKATTITDLGFDFFDNPEGQLTFDPSLMNSDLAPSCHSHLTQIIGENGATFVKDTLDMAGLFPQHCAKLKTLAEDAQGNMLGAYDAMNARIGFLIKDPAVDLGNSIMAPSPFKDAFNVAANNTAEFIYSFNTIENVVVHSLIFASATATAAALGTMENKERQELQKDISNFFHRTRRSVPLNYLLASGGSTYAYMANSGVNPEMIWMGLGGMLAGSFTHKAINRANSRGFVKNLTLSARKNMSDLKNAVCIVSDKRAGELVDDSSSLSKTWKDHLKVPAIVTGAGVIATSLDAALTGGQVSGSILGVVGVTVPFIAYNIPEDTALHVIFGVAGGVVGGAYAGLSHAKRVLKSFLIDDCDNRPD